MSDGDDEPSVDETTEQSADEGAEENDAPAEETPEMEASGDDTDGVAGTDDEITDEEPTAGTDDAEGTTDENEETSDETNGEEDDEGTNEEETSEDDEATGDEESAEEDDDAADDADESNGAEDGAGDGNELPEPTESLDERLDGIETEIEEAETEADLDTVENDLDSAEADIEAADFPEPDEDEDEGATDPREELETRVTELREAIEDKRGPYADDAIEDIEGAKSTITETRWTDGGESEVVTAVESFLADADETLDEEFATESENHDDLVAVLDGVVETIEERTLDPDEDTETIATLLEATEELTANLDDAEEWDDLTVRQKLDVEGFYDVLTAENRKDFPPEWNAIKIYEKQNEPDPILRGLDTFGSEFMEAHCIESLKRMGSPEAFEAMHERAQGRDKPPIEVLGKIGDDRALDTLHEYIVGESDPALQKVTLKAIGEIGSPDSTQQVADRLVADNETVRSNAARALGLIGDTRAISPLADVLSEDDSNSVRASAAWALNQIGTEDALDAAREHADDRSFLVQTEAEKAEQALTGEGDTTETAA